MDISKSTLVFIKGLPGQDKQWNKFVKLLEKEAEISERFQVIVFPYTPFLKGNSIANNFDKVTRQFHDWLFDHLGTVNPTIDHTNPNSPQVVLVGMGLGGILAFNFLKGILEDNNENRFNQFLRCLRQLILFDTPLIKFFDLAKYLISLSDIDWDQVANEDTLFQINHSINNVLNFVHEKIVDADEFKNNEWPIPIVNIKTFDDQVLPVEAAWFPEPAVRRINLNHQELISPFDKKSKSLQVLKKYLFDPIGHKNVFEIDEFIYQIQIEPFPLGAKSIPKFRKENELDEPPIKDVYCENKGVVTRSVSFSKTNICYDQFIIKYGTTNPKGAIIPHYSPSYLTMPSEVIADYNKGGMIFKFLFHPGQELHYTYSVEVYKGFDGTKGQNAHFHLEKGKRYYNIKRIKLNLEKYNNDAFHLVKPPTLYLMDEDTHNCAETPFYRKPENSIQPKRADLERYLWEWELFNIRSGVLDIVWEIDETNVDKAIVTKNTGYIPNHLSRLKDNRMEQEKLALLLLLLQCNFFTDRRKIMAFISADMPKEVIQYIDSGATLKNLVTDLIDECIRYNVFEQLLEQVRFSCAGQDIMEEVEAFLEPD